jgi:hypothetical protein
MVLRKCGKNHVEMLGSWHSGAITIFF